MRRMRPSAQRFHLQSSICGCSDEYAASSIRHAAKPTSPDTGAGLPARSACANYFRSKEQLLFLAKNLLFERVYERVQQARATGAAADRLLSMALQILPMDSDSLNRWRVLTAFNGLATGHPEITLLQARRNSRFARLFAEAIAGLQREGMVAKAVAADTEAGAIMAMVDGIAGQLVMAHRSWKRQQVIAVLKRYIQTLQ